MAYGQPVAGRYRLLRPLAEGGAGRVWLAADEMLHRQVAIRRWGLTMREARALARVGDPNLVGVLDVLPGDGDGEPWIVLEYVPARTLLQVIGESGPLSPARAATVGLAVLHALTATSRTGAPHLDVGPETVLIGDNGRIVLSDFGPPLPDDAAEPVTGDPAGPPLCRAPERALGGDPTPAADLWSLGATLFHAVEGRPPAAGDTPDRPRRAGPLTAVLDDLLQRDPAARPRLSEVEERLQAVVGPPPAPEARPAAAAVLPAPQRHRWAAVAAVAVIAAAGAAAATTGDDDHGAAPRPSVVASASARTNHALPRDFRWWTDPAGFRLAVPRGWRHHHDPAGVLVFTAPAGRPTLRISRPAAPPNDVVAALTAEEGEGRLPAYRRIRIEALPGTPAAVWEYTFRDPAAGPTRALRRLLVADGRAYALEWRAPKAAWAPGLPTLTVMLDSFEPVTGA
ncbi:serine/threonine-protein kinase [Actinoplanes sp. NPDC049316]|uniref:serine/threonine-protein kinase n=1 Tax=Actinoplanes sp. NPDC049316 TaxID=3154727 RepID=UPI00343C7CC6